MEHNYQNQTLSPEDRAQNLLEQMTLEEKVNQIARKMVISPILDIEVDYRKRDFFAEAHTRGGFANESI